jgi:hypothetical protein
MSLAVSFWQCIASAVTTLPRTSTYLSIACITGISFVFSSTVSCPNTTPFCVKYAVIICNFSRFPFAVEHMVLPSNATTSPSMPSISRIMFINIWATCSPSTKFMIRVKVDFDGDLSIPKCFLKKLKFDFAYVTMSCNSSNPHKIPHVTIINTSVNLCSTKLQYRVSFILLKWLS